jgi:hypothetical protein
LVGVHDSRRVIKRPRRDWCHLGFSMVYLIAVYSPSQWLYWLIAWLSDMPGQLEEISASDRMCKHSL